VGVVVIGRNEGERLRECLRSLERCGSPIVYVDSGSADGSADLARSMGVEVLELDPAEPFSVARARNSGLGHLVRSHPGTEYIQFVDADCIVAPGWIERALDEIARRPDVAVVGGRRTERFPEASLYNTLFDMEWERPVGECLSCGGDALVRVAAFREVGDFDRGLIGGEDTEFSYRLRQKGWRILQVDAPMTGHDAATFHFRQWWRRTVRTGYAYAQGALLHGSGPERYEVRPVLSALVWGLVLPVVTALLLVASWTRPPLLWLAGSVAVAYAVLFARIYRYRRRWGNTRGRAGLFAAFCVLSKVPHQLGILKLLWHRIRGRRARLIEYKGR
jgi:GT2 family glycosyltransferase